MNNKPVHEIQGLTEFRFGLTDVINKLKQGHDVHVQAYGLDREPIGTIKLTYEEVDASDNEG